MKKVELKSGWMLRDSSEDEEDWIHVESVPSVVQLDLLKQGRYVQTAAGAQWLRMRNQLMH